MMENLRHIVDEISWMLNAVLPVEFGTLDEKHLQNMATRHVTRLKSFSGRLMPRRQVAGNTMRNS